MMKDEQSDSIDLEEMETNDEEGDTNEDNDEIVSDGPNQDQHQRPEAHPQDYAGDEKHEEEEKEEEGNNEQEKQQNQEEDEHHGEEEEDEERDEHKAVEGRHPSNMHVAHPQPMPPMPYAMYPPPPYPYAPYYPPPSLPPSQPSPSSSSSALSSHHDPYSTVLTGVSSDPHTYTDLSTISDPAPDNRRNRGGVTEAFPEKLHRMLDAVEREGQTDIISFFAHGRAFCIHNPRKFCTEIMPRFFRQTRLTSFQRQLNLYGFRRISQGPDNGGYYHELFLKGRPGLCVNMKRTKIKGNVKLKKDPETEPNFYTMRPISSAPLSASPPSYNNNNNKYPYYPYAPPYTAAQQSRALPPIPPYPYPYPYPYYPYWAYPMAPGAPPSHGAPYPAPHPPIPPQSPPPDKTDQNLIPQSPVTVAPTTLRKDSDGTADDNKHGKSLKSDDDNDVVVRSQSPPPIPLAPATPTFHSPTASPTKTVSINKALQTSSDMTLQSPLLQTND